MDTVTSATGASQGSIDAGNLKASLLVVIDMPGAGLLIRIVSKSSNGLPVPNVLVTYLFPESDHTAYAMIDINSACNFVGLCTDGKSLLLPLTP